VPDLFLDPSRMQASLLWFGRGHVEYKFPNNAKIAKAEVEAIEFSIEISSEVPGTNSDWPSDISLWVNDVLAGTWTSPGDFGDKRGIYTPRWWKLEGSQYGKLTTWNISEKGCFVDGVKVSRITLKQLDLAAHHSIRLKIGIDERAKRPGGVNIFGRGFGNYDQDIVMRLYLRH
jgi:predicted transcriptional regulator